MTEMIANAVEVKAEVEVKVKKPRPIYRDAIWIDPAIVSNTYTHAGNSVEYYCYQENDKSNLKAVYIPADPITEFKAEKQSYVCFARLLEVVSASKKMVDGVTAQYNRVLYHMKTDERACVQLTLEEQKRFIKLSVENLMLPKYVTPDTLLNDKEGRVVFMLEDLTPSQLYMYLSQYRYLREDPGFVRSILHLHDKMGFDFYASFVIASRVSIDYTTHHFLTLQRQYGNQTANEVQNVTVPFSTVVGLRRFAVNPHEYDKRTAMGTSSGYEASSRIEKICKIKEQLKPHEFKEPLVKRAFCAMTDEISSKYLEQYKRMRERIKYRNKKETVNAAGADNQQ